MGVEHAIFLLNQKFIDDPILIQIFAPKTVRVFPGFADEPTDTEVSYPYIRYQFIDIPMRGMPFIRRDWCQFFVGDKDFTKVVNAVERMMWLLNIENWETLDLPVKDPDGKFKIMEIMAHTGTIPNQPSQDLGVWEMGISASMRYIIRTPSWNVTNRHKYSIDAKIL